MYKAIKYGIDGNILNLYEKYKSMFRFIIVGCINTGVDFLAFTVLHSHFGFDKLLCQVAGYSLGTVNSFILNKLWTFDNRKSNFNTANQIVRFTAVNLLSLGISLLAIKHINENLGVNIYVSKVIITGIAQAINYVGYKLWVFKNNSKPEKNTKT